MAKKIELELGDELSERLEKNASKVALSPSEMAKFIIAQALAQEKSIDWLALISKGREFLARLIPETRKKT